MIQRIIMVKFKDAYASEEARRRVLTETHKRLRSLKGIKGLQIGKPGDSATEGKWDMSVIILFESLQDVQTYIQDPKHRDYVDNYLKPKTAALKAWNMELVYPEP